MRKKNNYYFPNFLCCDDSSFFYKELKKNDILTFNLLFEFNKSIWNQITF